MFCLCFVIDSVALAKQGDNRIGSVPLSVRPSVCPSVNALTAEPFRGSALPSAAMSNNHHYQCKVIVCVSVISGHLRIIARMRLIGF